MKKKQLQ